MKIILEGTSEEIAALVVGLQGRQEYNEVDADTVIAEIQKNLEKEYQTANSGCYL